MQRRMITSLANLSSNFYTEVSTGLDWTIENALTLAGQAALLGEQKGYRGQEILNAAADEEAAKVLILLDAVRCPKGTLTRQLGYVYSHLAKGIYVEACSLSCNTFGELRGYVEHLCHQLHLDGDGEGSAWICENKILERREDKIYVDYVYWEDTGYQWNSPKKMEDLGVSSTMWGETRIIRLVRALHDVGITAPDALKVVASIWQGVPINDNFDWFVLESKNLETLEELDRLGLLRVDLKDPLCGLIHKGWTYPLYPLLLMRPIPVKRSELQEIVEETERRWWETVV